MKNEVCMSKIKMEWKLCRKHDGITTIRLHDLMNHNTNLSFPWLSTVEHNSFQTCWKLSEIKTFNNYLCNI